VTAKHYKVRVVSVGGQCRLTVAVQGQGVVKPAPGTYTYRAGTRVRLEAVPASGWVFSRWEGEVADARSAVTSLVVDRDEWVTAVFEPLAERLPRDSVVIGDTVVSVEYLFRPEAAARVQELLDRWLGERIYFQLQGVAEQWTDVFTGRPASQAELEQMVARAVLYVDPQGREVWLCGASADVTVEAGALGFKRVTVHGVRGVEGAAYFRVEGSSAVAGLGESVTVMTGEASVGVYVLDAQGGVLASGEVPVGQSREHMLVALRPE
jgi:hypothetical protein